MPFFHFTISPRLNSKSNPLCEPLLNLNINTLLNLILPSVCALAPKPLYMPLLKFNVFNFTISLRLSAESTLRATGEVLRNGGAGEGGNNELHHLGCGLGSELLLTIQ
jgi:hypothetical protein